MNMERSELKCNVREGYQVLLKARAELFLLSDHPKIQSFYQQVGEACIKWVTEVYGERLRKEFLEIENIRERARFHTQYYLFRMRCPWEDGSYAAVLCESELTGQWREPQKGFYRISHVWNLEEELALPIPQILRHFQKGLTKEKLPFRPDGVYPEGEKLVIFRNATDHSPFLEKKISRMPPKGGEE